MLCQAELHRLADVLAQHLPTISMLFVDECLASLRPGYSRWGRVILRRQLHRHLQSHAKRAPTALKLMLKVRSLLTLGGRLGAAPTKKRLAHGGTVIALLGGDGSGKSTCTQELAAWLGGDLDVMTAHLGRPPRSAPTLLVGGRLQIWRRFKNEPDDPREFPGYPQCLRELCTARHPHRLYLPARRFALAGGIALCERYPMPQNYELAGPRLDPYAERLSRNALGRWLMRREHRYYQDILAPDVLIVLRIDPELAVRRKTTEPADYVRARNLSISAADWSDSGARLVDAGRPLAYVIAALKAIIRAGLWPWLQRSLVLPAPARAV